MSAGIVVVLCVCLVCVLGMSVVMVVSARSSAKAAGERMRRLEELNEQREARLEEANRRLELTQQRLEAYAQDSHRRNTVEFRGIASETLREASESLLADSTRQLDSVLAPLKLKIDSFSNSVRESYVKDNATRKSLSDQIDRLMQLNLTIGDETRNLCAALKGNTKVQGEWGETVLETLLEGVGMVKNVNFFVQMGTGDSGHALADEAGKRLRPDVVVMLPDGHRMIVDSKVSLTAYLEYVEAPAGAARDKAARRHVDSVRRHVDELASKSYHSHVRDAAEHVLMFIPNEGAFFSALDIDPSLGKYAFDRNVVIVSPTHIFSVMQLVTQLWRQENQNRNAAEIARLGGLMYDKFVSFASELENIDRQLVASRAAYEKCRRHLTEGGTSLVSRAERMRELGAKANKRLPESLVRDVDRQFSDDKG